MRILVNGWFADEIGVGSGQYLREMLAALVEAAPRTRISVLVPAERVLDAGVVRLDIEVIRLRRAPLPAQLAKVWWEQAAVPWAARRLNADVLWVPYWAAPVWQPCPTVVTIHDLIPLLLPEYRGGALNRLYTALVAATARRCRRIITVSEAAARDVIAHLRVPAERVAAVHHGPNREERGSDRPSAAEMERVREKYALPERYFLYIGGFDVRKNVRGVLEAYARYLARDGDAGIKLVVAGALPRTESAFAPSPLKIAAELRLGDQVQLCGWVDDEDKGLLYALATGYIFPSLYEGFGMTVLEAMQAGTPVVTSAA